MDCRLPGSSVQILPNVLGQYPGGGCHFLLQGNLPKPVTEPGSAALQPYALPSELLGKPSDLLTVAHLTRMESMGGELVGSLLP